MGCKWSLFFFIAPIFFSDCWEVTLPPFVGGFTHLAEFFFWSSFCGFFKLHFSLSVGLVLPTPSLLSPAVFGFSVPLLYVLLAFLQIIFLTVFGCPPKLIIVPNLEFT